MNVSMKEFLETGKLGSLAFGLSRDAVRTVLGPPEDFSDPGKKKRVIWKYGSLQLHFDRDSLCFLGLYFRGEEFRLPKGISVEGWVPSGHTTLEEFQQYLAGSRIHFETVPRLTFESQATLRVGPGIHVTFDRDGAQTHLDSIQYMQSKETAALRPAAASGVASADELSN